MSPLIPLSATETNVSSVEELARFSEIIGALTTGIDLAEGNADGHALRTCIIGMRIGRRISLEPQALSDLFYALLLKDIGGAHTQSWDMAATGQGGLPARRLLREGSGGMSWRQWMRAALDLHHSKPFAERMRQRVAFFWDRRRLRGETAGYRSAAAHDLLEKLGVSHETRSAVCALDERWDGLGAPAGLSRTRVPVIAQIVKLSQMMEYLRAQGGSKHVIGSLHRRCRGWFDPGLIAAATRLFESPSCWWQLDQKDLLAYAISLEPRECILAANSATIDRVCEVFAEVADARSNYSRNHSSNVAEIAVHIARVMGLNEPQIMLLRRAALLHDLGKLAVPRAVLEKDGPLTEEELPVIRNYPRQTFEILNRVPELREIAQVASMHHERLDGSGYPTNLMGADLGLSARILAVADVAEALAAERSYRPKYSGHQIYSILMAQTPHALDARCVRALLHESVISLVA